MSISMAVGTPGLFRIGREVEGVRPMWRQLGCRLLSCCDGHLGSQKAEHQEPLDFPMCHALARALWRARSCEGSVHPSGK